MNLIELSEKWLSYVDGMLDHIFEQVTTEPSSYILKTNTRREALHRWDLERDIGMEVKIVTFNNIFYVVGK